MTKLVTSQSHFTNRPDIIFLQAVIFEYVGDGDGDAFGSVPHISQRLVSRILEIFVMF